MKSHFIVLFSILAILVSCQSGKNAEQALLKPEIRYELSGVPAIMTMP